MQRLLTITDLTVMDTLRPFGRMWDHYTTGWYQGTADIAGGRGGVPRLAPSD